MQITNKTLFLSSILTIFFILLIAVTASAQEAQPNGPITGILSQIAVQFHAKASQWSERLTHYALSLFKLLLTLDVCFLGIKSALKRTQLQDVIAEFIMLFLYAGIMLLILTHYTEWTNMMIRGLSGVGEELGAPPATAGSVFIAGIQIFDILLNSINYNVAKAIGIILIAIAICITFSLIAAQVIVIKCEGYIILNAGIILLGFGGSKITKDYAVNFIKYACSVAMKLFSIQLLLSLSIEFIASFRNTEATFSQTLVILGASIIILVLAMTIPDIISGLINGPLTTSGGALTSAVTAVSTGTNTALQGVKGTLGSAASAKDGVAAVREASGFADTAGMTGFGKLGHMATSGINAMRDGRSPSGAAKLGSSIKAQHEVFKMGKGGEGSGE
ncbi:P-type conjugative transfer protein TrbL [Maridesulfovibrio frigidus]|uniref:P-type conjugative transfer protein TrbL n=1 Tax=Maridesulfovibrio frigidus TaxID=340956 RepID=UPI0004E275D7|nr:P-type conjugative transfer protein TrbL [Maridesulfovibrio frigidus]